MTAGDKSVLRVIRLTGITTPLIPINETRITHVKANPIRKCRSLRSG
ncbi:hypothetical protein Z949_214 [Sulfitobacter guttiformis KCTC 32187]|nr:hypothetical protein Z949_214 [Sulfitobacter guttiformis KCTC 32187]